VWKRFVLSKQLVEIVNKKLPKATDSDFPAALPQAVGPRLMIGYQRRPGNREPRSVFPLNQRIGKVLLDPLNLI